VVDEDHLTCIHDGSGEGGALALRCWKGWLTVPSAMEKPVKSVCMVEVNGRHGSSFQTSSKEEKKIRKGESRKREEE
jgi:hypothetical protein